MIRACFTENRLTVSGHAGYAPKGQDIVCAAVTALVFALAGYLEKQDRAAELIMRPGYVTVAATGYSPAFEVIRCGMQQLAADYPENVEVAGNQERGEKS